MRRIDPDALYHFLLNNWPAWASTVCPEVEPDRPAEPVAPAPAADPRLTDGELWEAYLAGWRGNMTPNHLPPELGEQGVARLRAVADAQLANAGVTISEAEIRTATSCAWTSDSRDRVIALLRSKGVEVTE